MSGDLAVFVWVVASFAAFLTSHVSLAAGLLGKPPRWRAAVALVALPMAPYWGYVEGLRVRTAMWAVCFGSYAVALGVASR